MPKLKEILFHPSLVRKTTLLLKFAGRNAVWNKTAGVHSRRRSRIPRPSGWLHCGEKSIVRAVSCIQCALQASFRRRASLPPATAKLCYIPLPPWGIGGELSWDSIPNLSVYNVVIYSSVRTPEMCWLLVQVFKFKCMEEMSQKLSFCIYIQVIYNTYVTYVYMNIIIDIHVIPLSLSQNLRPTSAIFPQQKCCYSHFGR